ncbi:uncharacterized protein [Nicotiana sylvestris]|uniref:uncharacterized protein n=1 Tax=Nicotiana sylvestris TaxID=4096 RepID=UPI00388C68B1
MALNNEPIGNVHLGEDVDDNAMDEVPIEPQANRRGHPPHDNVPIPPPPPPRAATHRQLPDEGYASAIVPPRIREGNFQITNVMVTLIKQWGLFTGSPNQNVYKNLKGLVDTYWGRKQTNVSEDALRLRLFPFSLRGKVLDWLQRLLNHSTTIWDKLAEKFISKFFSTRHMATLRDEILAFKQEPIEPLHEIWERYCTMVKECSNNDMTEAMIQHTFYRGINTTNQYVVNQLAEGNFMNTPYAVACKILDEMADTPSAWQSRANVPQGDPNVIHLHKELHDHEQAIAELTTTMNQLAKAQLQQVQEPKQMHAVEGVNMMVNKRWQQCQQMQNCQEQFMQDDSGYDQGDSFNEQDEEVQYVNNYQGQRNNALGKNQQQWRSQGNQASHNTSIRNLEVQLGQISHALNTHPKGALPSDTVVNPKGDNNTGRAMAVTTRSGKGGDATTSNKKRIVDEYVVVQEDEILSNVVQANEKVRIDIDERVEETQE